MGERDARAQDGQIQVQADRGGARQQGRAHRLRADDPGRPIRRPAGRRLNERSYSIGSFRRQGDQHRGRRRSDVNQEKAWKPEYRSAPKRARRNDEVKSHADESSGPADSSFPHQQAEDMTAPETSTAASKRPLTTGRRPDMTAICAFRPKTRVASGRTP